MAERELVIKVTLDDAGATAKVDGLNTSLKANETIAQKAAEAEKRLDASFREAEKGANAAEKAAAKLGQSHREAGLGVENLSQKIMQFAGPMVLALAMKRLVDFGGDLQDTSEKLGIAASAFDRLTQMTHEFSIESGSVVQAMLTLQDRIGSNDKGAVAALNKLNINLAEFVRSNPDQMFYTLAAAVKELSTHQERVAVLSDLGGRSFRQFAGMMGEDLDKLKTQYTVLGDASAKELDRMGESWDRLLNAAKRYAAGALAALNVGYRTGEAFRESFNPLAPPGKPGRDRSLENPASNRNERADLLLGLDVGATDAMNPPKPPLESRDIFPAILAGSSVGSTLPGSEFFGSSNQSIEDTLQAAQSNEWYAQFDAAQAEADAFAASLEAVPPKIDAIGAAVQGVTSSFHEMAIAAGNAIKIAVPPDFNWNLAYEEAGVGSGFGSAPMGGGAASAASQLQTARTARDVKSWGGGGGASVTVNANGAFFQNDAMIKQLADQVSAAIAQTFSAARKW